MPQEKERGPIAAVVAAAGRSVRMGQPKQILPWGSSTVIATVLQNLAHAGADRVLCVVGHRAEDMRTVLCATSAEVVFNPDYQTREMLSSYQAGIRFLQASYAQAGQHPPLLGTLLALGDQPHIPVTIIRQVIEQARRTPYRLIMPSYAKRRGHPFFLPAALWPELLALSFEETLRTLIRRHQHQIEYIDVDSDTILRDIDTPDDYQKLVDQCA